MAQIQLNRESVLQKDLLAKEKNVLRWVLLKFLLLNQTIVLNLFLILFLIFSLNKYLFPLQRAHLAKLIR